MEGLPIIEGGLNRLLKPYRVSVVISGIFCHQTPKVNSLTPDPSSASCELGDIAFLATYDKLPAPAGLGNAILCQAKEHFQIGGAPDQELLYEMTEEFEYASPKPLTSQKRSLAFAHSCLYYWDFSQHFIFSYPSSTTAILARPRPPVNHYRFPFEETLTDLFCGISGRGFLKTPTDKGWSAIIHDLVKNATMRTLKNKKIFSAHGKPTPSRLFNYISALRELGAQTMVRCSLGEFLSRFEDKELADAGEVLEREARDFEWREDGQDSQNHDEGAARPPPSFMKRDSDDGGGENFVVFQFKSIAAPVNPA